VSARRSTQRLVARALRPRETEGLLVAPVLVSDRTAAALVGLEPRAFRAFVAEKNIPCTRIGKRLLVRATDLAEAIGKDGVGVPSVDDEDNEGLTRAEILRRVAEGQR
jgi:hypothetical protein